MYGNAAASTDHVAAATGAKSTTERQRTATVRAATSSDPRSRTFHAACRNAAARANASASSGTRERALRRAQERVAERDAELVPALDPGGNLRAQLGGVAADRWIVGIPEPALELPCGHLRMELHRPARVSEPERLRAALAAVRLDRAAGHAVRVVVPLERLDPLREGVEHRVCGDALDLDEADLRATCERTDPRPRRAGEQPHAEADAERRHSVGENRFEPAQLPQDPGVLPLLVGVHRAAEHERRVVRLERLGRRRFPDEAPFVELVAGRGDRGRKQLGARLAPVDDGEDPHAPPLAGMPFMSSSLRSRRAPSAACEIRPSGFSGSSADELLLKNAYASFASP